MVKFDRLRKKLLADSEVSKEYEAHKAEFEIAHALIKARLASKMTQSEVAKRMY